MRVCVCVCACVCVTPLPLIIILVLWLVLADVAAALHEDAQVLQGGGQTRCRTQACNGFPVSGVARVRSPAAAVFTLLHSALLYLSWLLATDY